jgi:hypothetical protein
VKFINAYPTLNLSVTIFEISAELEFTYLQLFEKSVRKVHEVVLPEAWLSKQPVKGKRLPRRKGPAGTVHAVRRTG